MRADFVNITDDCLYIIFRELGIKDQLSLAETCLRFNDVIVNMIWKRKYEELFTWNRELFILTKDEYERFIKLIAPNVRKLRISGISRCFQEIDQENEQELYSIFKFKFPYLEEFDCEDKNLNDEHIRLLVENSPRLHTLSYETTTGKHLALMSNLRSLELRSADLDVNCLSDLLSVNRLKTLSIVEAKKIDLGEAFRMTYKSNLIVNLEELYISGYHATPEFVTYLHMFDNLKLLEVHFVEKSLNKCWLDIAKKLESRIHGLHIKQKLYYPSVELDDIPIVDILNELKNLKNLRVLDIDDNNINDALPLITNSVNLRQINIHVIFNRKNLFKNFIRTLVSQIDQMKQINLPVITVTLVEYSLGVSKAYLDLVESVPAASKMIKFVPVLKKYKVKNLPKFAVGNCISFKLK